MVLLNLKMIRVMILYIQYAHYLMPCSNVVKEATFQVKTLQQMKGHANFVLRCTSNSACLKSPVNMAANYYSRNLPVVILRTLTSTKDTVTL